MRERDEIEKEIERGRKQERERELADIHTDIDKATSCTIMLLSP